MHSFLAILPLHEPLLIFTVLMGVILLSPFLFRLFKIPDIATFIIAGVIIGPYGLNVLSRDSSIELLGTVGLLYILFVAGLELDPDKLKSSKKNSIIFGTFTFIVPFTLGFLVSRYLLQLDFNATLLVSIMFSTHTLVAYPIVRKLGVNKDDSVLMAIGGTIITDTLGLLILSFITQTYSETSVLLQIVKLLVPFGFYVVLIFYSYPKIAHWFFKYVKRDRPVHYLFLLLLVSFSSVLAEAIGIEAIIGAFIAGLALNRSIPKNSLLMQHVDLVGNILFIPIFLIGIGMLINTRVLFSGSYLWYISSILITAAFAGKWLAAYFSQKILGFSIIQRNLLFGLTNSRAAATIAIILIAYEREMVSIAIFNSTILLILVTCIAAAFITEKYGKKIALSSETNLINSYKDRILVPIANPATAGNLVILANSMQNSLSTEPVYILNIVNDDEGTRDNLLKIRKGLEESVSEFNHLNENLKVITRVDLNTSSGILRAAKEYMVTDIVFGWSDYSTRSQRIFGSIFDHLTSGLQTLFAVKIKAIITEFKKVSVYVPDKLVFEPSFSSIIMHISRLPIEEVEIEFKAGDNDSLGKIKAILPKRNKQKISYLISDMELTKVNPEILNVLFILRKQSIAYNPVHNTNTKKAIAANPDGEFIIIVPGFE
ncbi:MAG: cation:proton antiporter [Bacteroidales bacterium]|nr:cation:proton antiporter [Bacteroidales bacterium]MCF8391773.1 cation:proton antiporter [Bacteroidales bacterium]